MPMDDATISSADATSAPASSTGQGGPVSFDGLDADASSVETQNTEGQQATATDGKGTDGAGGSRTATDPGAGGKTEGEQPKGADKDLERFDRHPRFQELVRDRNDLRRELQVLKTEHQKVVDHLNQAAKRAQGQERPKDYAAQYAAIDRKLEDGEISLAQARQMERQIRAAEEQDRAQAMAQQQATQAQITRHLEAFRKEHGDFDEVVGSEDFRQARQANPMHDALSAYYATKAARLQVQMEKAIRDAEAKAVKATEERMTRNFQAKRNAAALGAGPRGGGYDGDAELRNVPEDQLTHVLAARLAARRKGGVG